MTARKPIKPIYYKTGKVYTITLNPYDKYQTGNINWPNKFSKIRNDLDKVLEPHNDTIFYELQWDISCPREINDGKIPRLHLYGIIYFKTNSAITIFLLSILPELSHRFYIYLDTLGETDDDKRYWYDYIHKCDHLIPYAPIQNSIELKRPSSDGPVEI